MKRNQWIAWIVAGALCLSSLFPAYPVKTASAMTVLETNVTTASEGCTFLGVYGSYYSQAQDGLDRINEIRKEACESGNVPDPRNKSRMLTASDYVPLKWSTALESVARIRAAEGGLSFSFLSSGHNRLNQKGTFSVSYNGVSSSAEDLAYNTGKSMVSGINQWYGEKSDWVNQTTGKVTGHYTSMINPNYTYVGLGDFYTDAAQYPNTLSGEFSSTSQQLDTTMQDAPTDVMQKIEVSNSYIDSYFLDGVKTIYTDKSTTLTPRVKLVNGSKGVNLWVISPVEFSSSNDAVATVTNDGIVTGHRNGEATIKARSGDEVLASTVITVKCNHSKELLSTVPATCIQEGSNIYRCEICGESIEQKIPKTAHNYIYGDADSDGRRTGTCSVCQDTITIIPPTSYTLWWRNSTSGSSSYSSGFPGSNPIGSTIYCWIDKVDGDTDYQDMIIETTDESVISVPETAKPNSAYNQLSVLSPGITTIAIYPKYNPSLKKSFTVRVGDAGSVDITTADTELSQTSYVYTGKACTPTVRVSYHDVLLTSGRDYTVSYKNNIEAGVASVLIQGTGIFNGMIQKDFMITEAAEGETPTPTIESVTPKPTATARPTAGTATPRPTVGTATPRPTAGTATPRPTVGIATARPTAGTATPRPTAGTATPRPTAGTATTRPTVGIATARPTAGTATPRPTGTLVPTPEIPIATSDVVIPIPTLEVIVPTATAGSPTLTPGTVRPMPTTGTSVTILGTATPIPTPVPNRSNLIKGTFHTIAACQYQITGDSTIAFTGMEDRYATKVKVPETVQIGGKTFTVTAIEDYAFKNNSNLKCITVGNNVETIGKGAFEGSRKLTKITIGTGVTKIDRDAFKNCKKLKTIVIKSTSLEKVGKNALNGIKGPVKIKVPAKRFLKYKKLFKNKGQRKKLKFVKL